MGSIALRHSRGQTRWRVTRIANVAREVGGGEGFFGCRGSVMWHYEALRVGGSGDLAWRVFDFICFSFNFGACVRTIRRHNTQLENRMLNLVRSATRCR